MTNWEEKQGIIKKLEDHIKRGPPLKERINLAVFAINAQKEKLDQMYTKLQERDKDMFMQAVASLASGDQQRAAIYANECSEIRKMAKVVLASQLVLEQVAIRLQTVEEFGDLAVAMVPIKAIMEDTRAKLAGVVPDVAESLESVNDSLGKTMIEMGEAANAEEPTLTQNEEAKKILEEANAVAEQKISDRFPRLPTAENALAKQAEALAEGSAGEAERQPEPAIPAHDVHPKLAASTPSVALSQEPRQIPAQKQERQSPSPELEERVLQYVKAHGGTLRLSQASQDLGAPSDAIKQALINLSAKGKVKLA
ncbi:MAG: hypothetical protein ACP5UI_04635 [Thermoprotei archaeon]|nr:Snf7 family protein [TACK group archaeon]